MNSQLSELVGTLPDAIKTGLKGPAATECTTIIIPSKPIAKGRPRYTRQGHCYTPKKTLEAEQFVQLIAQSQMGNKPLSGSLAVELLAICPIPASWSKKKRQAALMGDLRPETKPDFDNILKLYCDALNGSLWKDDKQIVDGRCIKCYGENPAVILWCWEA